MLIGLGQEHIIELVCFTQTMLWWHFLSGTSINSTVVLLHIYLSVLQAGRLTSVTNDVIQLCHHSKNVTVSHMPIVD